MVEWHFYNDFSKLLLQILYSLLCVVTDVSVPLSQRLASDLEDFHKCLEQKRRNILFWSLQIGSKLGYSFNAMPGIHSSALAFTSCLCRSQRSAKGGSLESYHIFSEYPAMGMHVTLQIPWYM